MAKVTDINARVASYRDSTRRFAEWVEEHLDVLAGVRGIAALGEAGAPAMVALAEATPLRRTRLAWEFVRTMVESDGLDVEPLLLAEMPLEWVELVSASFDALAQYAN